MSRQYGCQWKGLSKLAKQYSTQVLGIKLGLEPIVVVYGDHNVRRVFTEKVFEGRPNSFFLRLRCLGKKMGITFADGELWKEHRKFTVKHLKNVGFGKTAMEGEIQRELQYIIKYIDDHNNTPINPKTILAISVMNILWKFTAEEQLKVVCLDLLIAGSQTTSNALEFAILGVLRNKNIQEKIFKEIYTILGNKMPSWSDSNRLVYTMAYLYECQRYFTIVPLAGPRRVLEDVTMDDYLIPKDTTVLISVGDVHFDSEIWEAPDKFMPERFIDDRGKLMKTENIYPFGIGRRRCPGDALAKSFIFIVFVGIIQKYQIVCRDGELPSDEPIVGLISSARPYTAEFRMRDT
ncbi:unnamed protein product [Danaus chrysippus]|uniref:(African queen) hypothetical protein n=1 Tax=Danaus chrysippus TaxID=151541 RepID=A0A8J2MI22_9NEOP|nr:unnamed protein product [Danaus chrysippus]